MKTIAIICMLIDHIGLLFFPDVWQLRAIGRLAMPIFAYSLARGSLYTSSIKRYMKKLFIFACLSQLPFWGMLYLAGELDFSWMHFNIGFTFLIALICINILEKMKNSKPIERFMSMGMLFIIMMLSEVFGCDYGIYGILLVLGFYGVLRTQQSLALLPIIYTLVTWLNYSLVPSSFWLQEMGVLACAIIIGLRSVSERRIGKLFYCFYPLHMILLCLIKLWF